MLAAAQTSFITAGLSAMLYQEGRQSGNAETVGKAKGPAKTILSPFFGAQFYVRVN